jgi:hypothetical protein
MSNDVFGQLCFFTFVDVPSIQSYQGSEVYSHTVKPKRVKLATIYCNRSESETYFLEFKSANAMMSSRIVAEFTFREML